MTMTTGRHLTTDLAATVRVSEPLRLVPRGWLALDEPGAAPLRLPGPAQPPLALGRGRRNDVVVPDEDTLASRRHAEIVWAGPGQWLVTDLCSSNGTFVGSARIVVPTVMTHDQVLQIGQTAYRLTVEGLPS